MSYTSFTKTIAASNSAARSAALSVSGELALSVEISNGAATDMNDFFVEARDHADGEWYTFISSADIDNGIADNILFVEGDPGGLAAGAKAHLHFRANGVRDVRFGGTLASGSGTLTIRGGKSSV